MKKDWTKGLNAQEIEDVTSSFRAGLVMRQRMVRLLEDKVVSSHNASISKDGYANPNWQYLQADNVGYQRAIKEIISLLIENK